MSEGQSGGRETTGRVTATGRTGTSAPAWSEPRPRRSTEVRTDRQWFKAVLGALCVLVFAIVAAGGALYVRLLHGAVALDSLAPFVARSIESEFDGRTVRMDGLELELDDSRSFQLVMRQVQIAEADGTPLAAAPRARLTLSSSALKRGALAPEKIELVAPRLQVALGDDGSVAVSISASPAVGPVPQEATEQQVPLVRAITGLSDRARRRESATGYLRSVVLTQAVVVVASSQRRTIWNVPELHLDLDHKRQRSLMAARATIATLAGPFTVSINTTEAARADHLDIDMTVRDLNLHGLGRIVPALAVFERFDLPLDGEAKLTLGSDGRLRTAAMTMNGDAAARQMAGHAGAGALVDRASLDASYDGATGRVDIRRLLLGYGAGEVTLKGVVAPPPANQSAWTYALESVDGRVGAPTPGAAPTRIDQLTVQGTAQAETGQFTLASMLLRAGGAEVTASGAIARGPRGPQGSFDGRFGAMSVRQFIAIWPESLAPRARGWASSHLVKGAVAAGSFRAALDPPAGGDPMAGPAVRLGMTVEATGVELQLADGLPPLEIQRGLVRVEGQSLEITAPEALIAGQDGRKLAFRAARFTAVETAPGEQPTAEVAFRLVGPLATAVDIADRPALQVLKSRGLNLPGLDGRIDGQVKLVFPLAENVQATELRADAKVRLTDLKARQFAGAIDLSGGTIAVDVDDKAIDLKGDLLVKGVAAKLNWQYLFNMPAARQAPVRMTATLDNADRLALGMDVADIVQGEVPVEITVTFGDQGHAQTRVRADLTRAELTFEAIAWRKAPGRSAVLQFDPARGPGTGAAQRIELQQFKLAGDDVAVEGWLAIGGDNRLREFSFPSFSVNVVTRLEVHGKLRSDRVWDVQAKGSAFDGRDMFRALFNLGPSTPAPKPLERNGLDLTAEIDTVIGFTDTNLRGVRIKAGRREDKLTALDMKATLDGGKPFAALIRTVPGAGRQLLAEGADAGQIFKLVGFYPNAVGGLMQLEVNLDAKGVSEKSGTLWARDFSVLGDPVVSEVFQDAESGPQARSAGASRQRVVRQQFDFEGLRIPFSVGSGQFVMNDAVLRGPLIGATFRGRIDFKGQTINVGGTYVPASGLNSAIGGILGPLSGGPQGEGLFGITFAVQGPLARPQAIVNPFSLLAPGIFRELTQMTPETFKIIPRDETGRDGGRARTKAAPPPATRASSTAVEQKTPDAAAPPKVKPEVGSDWSSRIRREQRNP